MNTSELIKKLAEQLKISQKQARELLLLYFGMISKDLAEGKRVVLRGFGSFETKQTKPRKMRLPTRGERVLIPSRRIAQFRPSQILKEEIKSWKPSHDG